MRKNIIQLILLTAALVSACGGVQSEPEPTLLLPSETVTPNPVIYSIHVSAMPEHGGAVAPRSEEAPAGSLIQVQAKAAPGYEFVGWSGDVVEYSKNLTISLDDNMELVAHFKALPTPTPVPPTITPTPDATNTPESAPTTEVGPITAWCSTHVGCERFEVKNKMDTWINIYLVFLDENMKEAWSIPPRGHRWIDLRPGMYQYTFTYCNGQNVESGTHVLNQNWYVEFKGACK